MNPLLEQLLVVQDRDARLLRLTSELSNLPLEREAINRQSTQAKESVEEAKMAVKRIEADRKKVEMEVGQKQEQVGKYKNQLLEIKNNDQFHALQHEIASAETEIRKMEDGVLELMERGEKTSLALKDAEIALKQVQDRLSLQLKELDHKAGVFEKQSIELKEERTRLVSGIEEGVLGRYQRIFQSKHGQAIVGIKHGMCSGCNIKLTAQEIHTARHDDELVTCTNCGRILYWIPE